MTPSCTQPLSHPPRRQWVAHGRTGVSSQRTRSRSFPSPAVPEQRPELERRADTADNAGRHVTEEVGSRW